MMAGKLVGYFEVRLVDGNSHGAPDTIDIYGNDQFYLGRNPALCRGHWPDPTISNKHLRVHCILYEQTTPSDIPPLVYATDVSSNGTFLKKQNTACASSQTDHGVLMTGKHGAFLLDHEDELRISDFVTLVYHSMEEDFQSMTLSQEPERQYFASRYLVTGRLLGKGGFGKVVVAIHQKTQRQIACKIVNLKGLYESNTPNLRLPSMEESQLSTCNGSSKRWPSKLTRCCREFRILKDLSHPNIIGIEKVFWSPNTIYMFQELVTGGDLFSFMERKVDPLSTIDAAVIVRQIVIAIDYLHDRNIVHRDLKPDNILLTFPRDGARIVLTDFGNAIVVPKSVNGERKRLFTKTGTWEYVAPEVYGINETIPAGLGYSKAVDMWSIGVIAASLLSGESIFSAPRYAPDPRKVILDAASKCDISVIDDPNHRAWSKVGHRAKDFIRNLLVLREEDRMSVKQALAHPWFSNECHAAEFEALYQRSITDWEPRRKTFKLIESIIMPSTEQATHFQSHHFQQPSVQASFHEFQERFSGSRGWDLSVPYPPSEGDSIEMEHEEADLDGPERYDEHSYEEQEYYDDKMDASMNQPSFNDNSPASGMYSRSPSATSTANFPDLRTSQANEVSTQQYNPRRDAPDTSSQYGTPFHADDSLLDSPVPYPPFTQANSEVLSEMQASRAGTEVSVVRETPELPRYNYVF